MLLDFDNMYMCMYEAITKYNITEIPALFSEPQPDHRTFTFYRTEF